VLVVEPPQWADARDLATRTLETPCPPPQWREGAAWLCRAAALRIQVLAAAGLWEDPAEARRSPPPAEVYERTDHPDLGYSVEKVLIETIPGIHVAGNLFRPSGAVEAAALPRPAVLNPHGHWPEGRFHHDELGSTFARCIAFARMGYVALCHDMAGYGDDDRMPHRWGDAGSWLWGGSPLGLQLWNAIRCLDFLQSLPDVDPERLGCTGESGGATQTLLLTAVDSRVKVSAPVNMVSLHYQGGCVCENAPGLRLDTNNVELAALAAPRPLLLVACTGDWTVNTPEREFPAIQGIYRLLGAEDRVAWHQEDAPHNYNRGSREAVYRFFARWLPPLPGREAAIPREEDVPAADPPEALRAFARRAAPAGPRGAAAEGHVRTWFRTRAEERLHALLPRGPADVVRLRQALVPYLAAVTGVQPVGRADVVGRPDGDITWIERRAAPGARCALRRIPPDAGTAVPVRLHLADGTAYALWPYGSHRRDAPWARSGRCAEADFFLCYNRADAAWAAQDVLAALAWTGGAPRLQADGPAAVAALLARALAPEAILSLEVTLDPDGGWADAALETAWLRPGAYLPGVLRAGGLAGLLALAAPAPTRVRGIPQGGLAGVAAIYRALGRPEAFAVE
jgi:hypothetical protein